ncbi:CDP-alcohol phosphatidyltransferase [Streptomyces thermovulgaris]|uniref:CDP-alcohol phosphatidyltransferase n=1 Tax=Streptomyces thermovulgaris TaxID=1934 RepID=UPI00318454C8
MPQHTSTHQSSGTTGATEHGIPSQQGGEPAPHQDEPRTAPAPADRAGNAPATDEARAAAPRDEDAPAGTADHTVAARTAEPRAATAPAAPADRTTDAPPGADAPAGTGASRSEAPPDEQGNTGTPAAERTGTAASSEGTGPEAAETAEPSETVESSGSSGTAGTAASSEGTGPEAAETTEAAAPKADDGSKAAESEAAAAAGRDADASADTGSPAGPAAAQPEAAARRPFRLLRALGPRTARQDDRRRRKARSGPARVLSPTVTVLAFLLVVAALLLPNKPDRFEVATFTRLPVELLLWGALLIVLPRRLRTVVAALGGLVLGVLTVLALTDIQFHEYLGRDFNMILDWQLLDDAQSYLADTLGGTVALLAAVGVVLLVLALLGLMTLAVVRIGSFVGRHRTRSMRGLMLLSVLWMLCAALDLRISGIPVASRHTVAMFEARQEGIRTTIEDEREFARTAKADPFGNTPAGQLVPDLRGKDMIFTFIESYGRSAIEDPVMAPGVNRTLEASTRALAAKGFHAKSGWLTSSTYGGGSWLGHSTFMSGLWIDNQNRYRTVTSGDHLTLTKVFRKTGAWDTVGIMPGVQKAWPEARWYGLDRVYNAFRMGYRGPKFSWSTMPDQYALEAFERLEHGRKHDKPLTSFVILTSSHQPWAPIPRMVGWDELGDGSVFKDIEAAGVRAADIITDPLRSREEYGKSVQYSLTALTEWMERYAKDNTVLVVLGDHQPKARVSGNNASRDVPVSIVAKDPKVLEKIADWGWTDGLRPAHDAPVWRMDAFRNRFLTAYGSVPHPSGGQELLQK